MTILEMHLNTDEANAMDVELIHNDKRYYVQLLDGLHRTSLNCLMFDDDGNEVSDNEIASRAEEYYRDNVRTEYLHCNDSDGNPLYARHICGMVQLLADNREFSNEDATPYKLEFTVLATADSEQEIQECIKAMQIKATLQAELPDCEDWFDEIASDVLSEAKSFWYHSRAFVRADNLRKIIYDHIKYDNTLIGILADSDVKLTSELLKVPDYVIYSLLDRLEYSDRRDIKADYDTLGKWIADTNHLDLLIKAIDFDLDTIGLVTNSEEVIELELNGHIYFCILSN